MPLSQIEPTAALIVVDLQKGILGFPTIHPAADIIRRTADIARAFRERELTVVLVNVDAAAPGRTDSGPLKFAFPPDFAEFVPELDQQPADYVVTKKRWGAFSGTDLNAYLQGRGVTQVVITGISTSAGVESTARSAYESGYNVVIVTDAVTDRDLDVHRNSVEKIFPRLAETTTTDELLAQLTTAV